MFLQLLFQVLGRLASLPHVCKWRKAHGVPWGEVPFCHVTLQRTPPNKQSFFCLNHWGGRRAGSLITLSHPLLISAFDVIPKPYRDRARERRGFPPIRSLQLRISSGRHSTNVLPVGEQILFHLLDLSCIWRVGKHQLVCFGTQLLYLWDEKETRWAIQALWFVLAKFYGRELTKQPHEP